MMYEKTEQSEGLTDSLAEGIAAVMAADEDLEETGDMADLFLEELNRLWAEPPADQAH
ncbi:MAG: hypothetical protein ABI398_14780 [Devosia sp.]